MLFTEPMPDLPPKLPLTIDFSTGFYFHREGRGLLMGGRLGREAGLQAGKTEEWLPALLQIAERRAPRIASAPIQGGWAGLYDMSPDHNAMVGEAKQVSRFLYATGFSGHGFLQAPATGEILRDLVLRRPPVVDVTALSAERFEGGTLAPEFHVVELKRRAPRRRTWTSPWTPSATRSSPGRLRPGERIKEIPLADELGFSRAPVRDALRLLERDGLVRLVPNRGAIVPELRAVDVLEVYALRASLGTLALHKLMLDSAALDLTPLDRELAKLLRAQERGRERDSIEADLGYQATVVAAAGLPRVAGEFDRLTWQVRMFLGALDIDVLAGLPRIVAEVQALHAAIVARDAETAARVWREKFERWISGLVGRLDEDFDDAHWVALTRGGSRR